MKREKSLIFFMLHIGVDFILSMKASKHTYANCQLKRQIEFTKELQNLLACTKTNSLLYLTESSKCNTASCSPPQAPVPSPGHRCHWHGCKKIVSDKLPMETSRNPRRSPIWVKSPTNKSVLIDPHIKITTKLHLPNHVCLPYLAPEFSILPGLSLSLACRLPLYRATDSGLGALLRKQHAS